tara:strand:+ start:501 stop:1325 length:825 start_codon:yes stop_codon:yes gene_type:complete
MEITLTTSSSCKEDPRKLQGAGCDIWGDKRLALALKTKEIIKDLEHPWFIESGTLLGAWRSGKFIPHDDDFDIALFLSSAGWEEELSAVQDTLAQELPAPYKVRRVSTYCDKLEIFDPTQGVYFLLGPQYNGADYHFVTIDLQVYIPSPLAEGTTVPLYRATPESHRVAVKTTDVLPLGTIVVEGETFPAPANVEAFLAEMYGYLGNGARFCEETGKYLPPLTTCTPCTSPDICSLAKLSLRTLPKSHPASLLHNLTKQTQNGNLEEGGKGCEG